MKKVKAFTLVELIVVIAIIGVLAAVLVPSLIGFVRDGRITQANSNAHMVFTSAQAWLTKYSIKEGTTNTKSKLEGWHLGADALTLDGTITLDEELGAAFKGVYGFKTDPTGTGIIFACWCGNETAPPALPSVPDSPAAQNARAVTGEYVGFHPMGS